MTIEHGVPLPPKRSAALRNHAGGRGKRKYPFPSMQPGDSFFTRENVLSAMSAASEYGKRHNQWFETRRMDGGVRVWRVHPPARFQ